jgi:ATP-binding cassette subfamily B protein
VSATRASRGALAALRELKPFLTPYRLRLLLAGLALLTAALATLAVPLAFRQLIDLGFSSAGLASASSAVASPELTPGTDSGVNRAFLVLFAVALVLAAATALRFYCVSWLGERVTADMRRAVYRQVLRQDPRFFETLRTGEVLSRLTTDTTLIQTLVGTSISLGLRNSLLFAGGLVMLIATSAQLAALIVGLLALVVIPIIVFARRVRRLSRDSQDRLADSSALAGETLGAIQIVQAYVREDFEDSRFARSTDAAFESAVRRVRARSLLAALSIVLVFGAIVFVLWLGAHAVLEGRMSTGLLMQFVLYAVLVGGAAGTVAEVYGDIQRAAGAVERLLELLAARPTISAPTQPMRLRDVHEHEQGNGAEPGGQAFDPASGPRPRAAEPVRAARLSFESVVFEYPSRPGERALDSVSFEVNPGARVAVVGPSGAGKSTLFQLLLRFHDPQAGVIRFDGIDLRQLDPADLRQAIGLVSQDSVVFSADAMENIRYGRLDASDDEVIAAARAARVEAFVERLPEGWRTFLGERGVRLSGGQRQRIAIARALLRNPRLLLLDEATSALDAESERDVQAALEQAMHGRTTLVIAHRLATVVDADRILVLEHGRVVESGTHASLAAGGGLYARLAALQFETP